MKHNNYTKLSILDFAPLILCIGIVPIVIWTHISPTSYGGYPWNTSGENLDLFLFGKSVAILITALLCIALIYQSHTKRKQTITLESEQYFLVAYAIFVILTTIFSTHKENAIFGCTDQFESAFVLVSYVVIAIFFSYQFKNLTTKGENFQGKLLWIIPLCLIPELLICISQFIGYDIFLFLFRSRNYVFNFGANRVYGSLYNPNYVGSYMALLIPLVLALMFAGQNKLYKILMGIMTGLLFLCLIGSQSSTGFIALVVVAVLYFILKIKNTKSALLFVAAILVVIASTFAIDHFSGNSYVNKIFSSFFSTGEEAHLEKIETLDDEVAVYYDGKELHIQMYINEAEGNSFVFTLTDEDGNAYPNTTDASSGQIQLQEEALKNITIYPAYISDLNNLLTFVVEIDGKEWIFTDQTDGTYYYVNNLGHLDKINNAEAFLFKENGSFASGRGYLWSRTIPLLKKYVLVGSGPDTFTAVFPQSDYVGKYNNGYENMLVTRPHNMYLQIAVQTGLFSLLCILAYYVIYMVQSIKLYRTTKAEGILWYIGYGCFLGTLGYMITGVFYDSSVTVAPIFWCMLGIGTGINLKLKNK